MRARNVTRPERGQRGTKERCLRKCQCQCQCQCRWNKTEGRSGQSPLHLVWLGGGASGWAALDQKPTQRFALFKTKEAKGSGDPRTVECEGNPIIRPLLVFVCAVIPNFNATFGRFPFRIRFVEWSELQCMILYLNRQALETRVFGQAFRDCPALEHTIFLEPKVKVMTSGPMLLDHEDRHSKNRCRFWCPVLPSRDRRSTMVRGSNLNGLQPALADSIAAPRGDRSCRSRG